MKKKKELSTSINKGTRKRTLFNHPWIALLLILTFSLLAGGCAALDSIDQFLSGEQMEDTGMEESETDVLSEDSILTTPTIQLSNDLIVWMPPQFAPGDGSLEREMMDSHIQAFIDGHSDVTVNVRIKSESGESSMINSLILTAAAAPDALPTAILLPSSDLDEAVQNGLIRALDSRVLNADWFPAAANLARVENDLYGLPAAMDAVIMVKQAGSVDAGYVPMDYAVGLADSFVFPAGSSNTLIPMILYQSGGGSYFDESGEITIDEDILLETFSMIDSFRRNRLFPDDLINLNSEGDAWASFVSGEFESIFTWARWPLAERNSYSLMHFPGLGEEPFTYARGWVWCLVEQNDLNEELGLALMDHMTGEDFLRTWSQESNYLPVRSSSLVGLDEQTNAKLSKILNSAVEIPPEQTVKEVKDDIINGMQDVFVGTKSPQAAVEEISQNLIGENE